MITSINMTIGREKPGAAEHAISRLRSRLGRSRLKWSARREQIVTAFLTENHVSVQRLYGLLNRNGQRTPLSTIYRTMRMLCDVGFAQPRYSGEKTVYENLSAISDHPHLVCRHCAQVAAFKDLPWKECARRSLEDKKSA